MDKVLSQLRKEYSMTIKEMREKTGLSQGKFANYFGISYRTIQQWEQERSNPPRYLVALLERIWSAENKERQNGSETRKQINKL